MAWEGGCPSVCWDRLALCVVGGDGPDPGLGPCGRPAAFDTLGQTEHG